MAEGKTYWFALDAAWLDRDAPDELGDEFGPGGPLTLIALMCAAKLENDGGRVHAAFRTLAKRNFTGDVDLTRRIVEHATAIGAIDDLKMHGAGRRFSCRLSGWQADQSKGRTAARVAAHRAGKEESPSYDPLHGVSSNASVGDRTGQDSTGQHSTSSSLRSEDVACPPDKKSTIRWRGKPIRPDHLDLATAILTAFNARAGTGYRPITRNGKPSEDLSRILGAIDDDDRITLPVAARMIDEAFTRPFWQGRPHAGVVFGPKVASGLLEQAVNPAPPGPPPPTSRGAGYLDELKRMHADATAEHPAPAAPPADITERTAA